MAPRQVLTISSLVAAGPVGNSAIVPALLAMGVTPVALPTVLLSNHPGHGRPEGLAVPAEKLAAMLERLVSLGLVALLSAGLLAGTAAAAVQVDGDLPRQADLGFRVRSTAEGLVTRRVDPQSAAHRAGLRDGDRLTRINGASFAKTYQGEALLEKLDGGKPLRLSILRDGASQEVTFTPPAKPLEQIEGLDSYYGVLDTPDGARLRTILTRPAHDAFPGRMINTHPALLPKHKGWHAVRDALAAGDVETGCTVHVAGLEVDTGPILAQAVVPVLPDDDEATLHERIKDVERPLYSQTLRGILDGSLPLPTTQET